MFNYKEVIILFIIFQSISKVIFAQASQSHDSLKNCLSGVEISVEPLYLFMDHDLFIQLGYHRNKSILKPFIKFECDLMTMKFIISSGGVTNTNVYIYQILNNKIGFSTYLFNFKKSKFSGLFISGLAGYGINIYKGNLSNFHYGPGFNIGFKIPIKNISLGTEMEWMFYWAHTYDVNNSKLEKRKPNMGMEIRN